MTEKSRHPSRMAAFFLSDLERQELLHERSNGSANNSQRQRDHTDDESSCMPLIGVRRGGRR